MSRLRKDDFLPLAISRKGTVRVNHNSPECSGDSKSLAITTKENGDVSAICFRCGATGFHGGTRYHRDSRALTRADESLAGKTVVDGVYRVPADLSQDLSREALDWLGKSGIPASRAAEWGFRWSESRATLYIPITKEWVKGEEPELAGYILRGFDPKSYLTLAHASAGFWGLYRGAPDTEQVVLCEDSLSARKVAEAGPDAIALCGVNLRPEALQYLLRRKYKEGVVWLDGDNPQVRMLQRRIVRNLAFMPNTRLIETGTDPKHESVASIKRLLVGG